MPKQYRLTDLTVKAAKIKTSSYFLSDGGGLYLRITPAGRRSWVLRKMHGGKTVTRTLGEYPDMSLSAARQSVALMVKDIDEGVTEIGAGITLRQAFQEWLKTRDLRPSSIGAYEARFKVLSAIADQPLITITPQRLRNVLAPLLSAEKIPTAKSALQLVSCAERHALAWGFIETPRLQFVRDVMPANEVVHRRSITPEQLPELFRDISQTPLTQHYKERAPYFALLLYTLLRTNEAVSLQWDFIDSSEHCLIIPASIMKTGVTHRVPITEPLQVVLDALCQQSCFANSPFVLQSSLKSDTHNGRNIFRRLFAALGITPRISPHGVRSLARSYFAEHNADFAAAEMCLAHHIENQVQRSYQRYDYLEQRRKLMAEWCDYVNACARLYLPNFPLSFD